MWLPISLAYYNLSNANVYKMKPRDYFVQDHIGQANLFGCSNLQKIKSFIFQNIDHQRWITNFENNLIKLLEIEKVCTMGKKKMLIEHLKAI